MENGSESVMLTWKDVIAEQKSQDYFKNIISFVKQERAQGKIIYPPSHEVFNAFRFTEFSGNRLSDQLGKAGCVSSQQCSYG